VCIAEKLVVLEDNRIAQMELGEEAGSTPRFLYGVFSVQDHVRCVGANGNFESLPSRVTAYLDRFTDGTQRATFVCVRIEWFDDR